MNKDEHKEKSESGVKISYVYMNISEGIILVFLLFWCIHSLCFVIDMIKKVGMSSVLTQFSALECNVFRNV